MTIRGTLFAILAAGAVTLPAEKSEAGLIDWLRCVFHPCKTTRCDPCPTPCAPACPEPTAAVCAPPVACTTSYIQRSYMEPQTCMTTQYRMECCPTYVRRSYWDPCAVRYRSYLEPTTSYVKRAYQVPVTTYVQRSYYQPVTSCTTPCATPACPTGTGCPTPVSPMTPVAPPQPMPSDGTAPPAANLGRPLASDRGPVLVPTFRPGGKNSHHAAPAAKHNSARRTIPLAADLNRLVR